MAIYPCQVGNHRYPQPQQSVYITLLDGRDPVTYRARMCPRHFRDWALLIEESLSLVTEDTQGSLACDRCGERRAGTVFGRVFPMKAEERMYASDLCATHFAAVRAALLEPTWEAMAAR